MTDDSDAGKHTQPLQHVLAFQIGFSTCDSRSRRSGASMRSRRHRARVTTCGKDQRRDPSIVIDMQMKARTIAARVDLKWRFRHQEADIVVAASVQFVADLVGVMSTCGTGRKIPGRKSRRRHREL